MSSLNLGELESAESPNKENGSGIAGLRNILFARNFQTSLLLVGNFYPFLISVQQIVVKSHTNKSNPR